MENNKKPIFLIISISLIFGIVGGVTGEIISRLYFLQETYRVPMFGEIDVAKNIYGGSNLIIESPKKVVVEQNTKVLETLRSGQKNIVGIFEKIDLEKETASTTLLFDLAKSYELRNPISQGFIITSDGWLMSNFLPLEFKTLKNAQATSTSIKIKNVILNKYVIITQNRDIYDLLDVQVSSDEDLSFWKIDAKDFSVREFEQISDIENGQLVIASNFQKTAWLTSVADKYNDLPKVLSSDKSYAEIILAQEISTDFGVGFLFNIDGDLLGLIDENGIIRPASTYFSCLSCLLDQKEIKSPYLGINYIDLQSYSNPNSTASETEGAMIYPDEGGVAIKKGSPAELAGLKIGDIITAVNTIKIKDNNNLSDLLLTFKPGEKLSLAIIRDKKEIQVQLKLGSIEKN